MRGALVTLAAGLGLAYLNAASAAHAGTVEAVVREKAAAIAIVRTRASRYTAALAQGRLFNAYLSASTLSEAERLKSRIVATLGALQHRYGLNEFMVVDREGRLFAHVGAREAVPGKRNLAGNPVLSDAFRQEPRTVATHLARDVVTYVAPVVREGQPAFVIAVAQDLTAYERVLLRGLGKSLYIAILDREGNIISDSAGAADTGRKALIAGLTLEELRRHLSADGNEGTGVVTRAGHDYRVSFQAVEDWTVVAIEQTQDGATCLRNGAGSCR